MLNAFTGESCPIVHLGDLAKLRGKKKRLVRCEGSIVATPLKSAIPPLLTKKEWEALLEGLCNHYKEGHERHFVGLYRGEMRKCMQDNAYRTFVSRPMTLEILLENLRIGFYDDNAGQTKLYLRNASSTGYYQTTGNADGSEISPVFDYWNIQLLPKSQRPVDMLFLKDLNLLWENVNAYDS